MDIAVFRKHHGYVVARTIGCECEAVHTHSGVKRCDRRAGRRGRPHCWSAGATRTRRLANPPPFTHTSVTTKNSVTTKSLEETNGRQEARAARPGTRGIIGAARAGPEAIWSPRQRYRDQGRADHRR